MTPDEKLNRVILDRARFEWGYTTAQPMDHLAQCPEAQAWDGCGEDGSYGCDTGCEYYRLSGTVSCPHGYSQDFEYGDFGTLYGILEEMDAYERSLRGPAQSPQV